MKTVDDIRLENAVSLMILTIVRPAIDGIFADVPNGDIQSICERVASNIINEVKGTPVKIALN